MARGFSQIPEWGFYFLPLTPKLFHCLTCLMTTFQAVDVPVPLIMWSLTPPVVLWDTMCLSPHRALSSP